MHERHAHLRTTNANRNLQQMCAHFEHREPVGLSRSEGRIELPFGACRPKAAAQRLRLSVNAAPGGVARVERVIGDHRARFDFHENPSPD